MARQYTYEYIDPKSEAADDWLDEYQAQQQERGVPAAGEMQTYSIPVKHEVTADTTLQDIARDCKLTVREVWILNSTTFGFLPGDLENTPVPVYKGTFIALPDTVTDLPAYLSGKTEDVVTGPVVPQLPPVKDRTDIVVDNPFDDTQKTKYHWDEALKEFETIHIVGKKDLEQERLEKWVRKCLKDGWDFTMPVIKDSDWDLYKTKLIGYHSKHGQGASLPVIEAFRYGDAHRDAGKLAGLIPDTGQNFYWKKKFDDDPEHYHLSGYGYIVEEQEDDETVDLNAGEVQVALAYYKKNNVIYDYRVAEKLYKISLDIWTYQKVQQSGLIDENYVELVRGAQEIIHQDDLSKIDGKLTSVESLLMDAWLLKSTIDQDVDRVYAYYLDDKFGRKTLTTNVPVQYDLSKLVIQQPQQANSFYPIAPVKKPDITSTYSPIDYSKTCFMPACTTAVAPQVQTYTEMKKTDHDHIYELAQKFTTTRSVPGYYDAAVDVTKKVEARFDKAQHDALLLSLDKQLDTKNTKDAQLKMLDSQDLTFMSQAAALLGGDDLALFQQWATVRMGMMEYDQTLEGPVPISFLQQMNDLDDQIERNPNRALGSFEGYDGFSDEPLVGYSPPFYNTNIPYTGRKVLFMNTYLLRNMLFEVAQSKKYESAWSSLAETWANVTNLKTAIRNLNKDYPNVTFEKLSAWYVPDDTDFKWEKHKKSDPRLKDRTFIPGCPLQMFYGYDDATKKHIIRLIGDPTKDPMTVTGDTFVDALDMINTDGWLEKGVLYYSGPTIARNSFITYKGVSISTILGYAGMVIATLALVASMIFTVGADAPVATAAIGWMWTASAIVGAAAGVWRIGELISQDRLTVANFSFELLNIAACLLPAGRFILGKSLRFFGGNLFALVSDTAMGTALVVDTMYFTYEFIMQMRAIEDLPPDQRDDARRRLIMFGIITGIFTYVGAKGLYKSRFSGEVIPPDLTPAEKQENLKLGSEEVKDPALMPKGSKPVVEGPVNENSSGGKSNGGGKTSPVNTNVPENITEQPIPESNEPIETYETTGTVETAETANSYEGKAAKWKFAGLVQRGAKIKDLIRMLRNLTKANGIEYAVVKFLKGPYAGQRCIVSGNEAGIMFEEGEIEYIYMHSHPTNAGASAEDFLALYKLDQSRQTIVEPDGTLQIRKPTEVPENVSRDGPVVVETPVKPGDDTPGLKLNNANQGGKNVSDIFKPQPVRYVQKFEPQLNEFIDIPVYNNVALGKDNIERTALLSFGSDVGANTYTNFTEIYQTPDYYTFDRTFTQVMNNTVAAKGTVFFDVAGVDVSVSIKGGLTFNDVTFAKGLVTECELQNILRNEGWFNQTLFHKNGLILTETEMNTMGLKLIGP